MLAHPDFIEGRHSTKWVEERLDLSGLESQPAPADLALPEDGRALSEVDAEVDGRRYRVKLWLPQPAAAAPGVRGGGSAGAGAGQSGGKRASRAAAGNHRASLPATAGDGSISVPMQGTIVKVLVAEGDEVAAGQTLCVLEAMKMENPINSDRAGAVTELRVKPGDALGAGDVVAVIK
jgi:acetyl-CoA/propionyl-CoA carboxylase biotin carboxyl carrier protein